jgi:hypothetical protein
MTLTRRQSDPSNINSHPPLTRLLSENGVRAFRARIPDVKHCSTKAANCLALLLAMGPVRQRADADLVNTMLDAAIETVGDSMNRL